MSDGMFTSRLIEEELEAHGVFASTTRGTSMEPLFRTHRDMVIITKCDGELKKYDVPLYRSCRGVYVLHRIVGVKDGEYLIRGDNTFVLEHFPHSSVVGVLREFNRKGKHHTVSDRGYIIYSRVWNFLYPVRFCLYKLRRLLGKLYRLIFKKAPPVKR